MKPIPAGVCVYACQPVTDHEIFTVDSDQKNLGNAVLITCRKTLCKEYGILSKTEVQILAQTLTSCVTLGRLLGLSDLQFPHLKSGVK